MLLADATPNVLSTAEAISAGAPGVVPTHVYQQVFDGFAAIIPDHQLGTIKNDPRVKAVVPDAVSHIAAQTVPTGIARINADNHPTARIDGIAEGVLRVAAEPAPPPPPTVDHGPVADDGGFCPPRLALDSASSLPACRTLSIPNHPVPRIPTPR